MKRTRVYENVSSTLGKYWHDDHETKSRRKSYITANKKIDNIEIKDQRPDSYYDNVASQILEYLITKNSKEITSFTSTIIFIYHFAYQLKKGIKLQDITFPTIPIKKTKKIIDMNFDTIEFVSKYSIDQTFI